MTQTASAETVFAKGIFDVAIAIRATTFAQTYNRIENNTNLFLINRIYTINYVL